MIGSFIYLFRSSPISARALQYCLEEGVNLLNDNDWVVHLDEETILTESSVKGVFNFAFEDKYHFGQGVIKYTNLGKVCKMSLKNCKTYTIYCNQHY